ncbi:MAG: alpha-amylase [Chloroflexota bacterium]
MNGTMMQFFQWYRAADGTLWRELRDQAADLAAHGFTAVWLPPAGKAQGGGLDVGYGTYDLFDLGEFDQKGSVRTKYGTKDELVSAVEALHAHGIQSYADVVFNHKDGGDRIEEVWAQEVDWNDRNRDLTDWYPIQTWSHFTFPGRGDTYSSYKWHWWHFDSVSYDQSRPHLGTSKLYRLRDKRFDTEVNPEHGNADYLMACDLDTTITDGELRYWGRWFVDTVNVDGFRLDAIKHIRAGFFRDWLNHLRRHFGGRELFTVGEYWSANLGDLLHYQALTAGVMSLFDVPLHYRFRDASVAGASYDLRTIFDGTLVQARPAQAVTFVDNHDSQPCQSLESWVEPWFKPLAYALILLRRDGYPCVFYGDYSAESHYQDKGRDVTLYSHRFLIDRFMRARRGYGYGDQHDYFDHPNTIGWLRLGTADHPGAMAVVLTNGAAGSKWMNTFRPHSTYTDVTGHIPGQIKANADGWAEFRCSGGSVSVWLQQ